MKYFKVAFFVFFVSLGIQGKAQSIQLKTESRLVAKYRFESDTSLLNLIQRWTMLAGYDFTYHGTQELPLMPEIKKIEAVTYSEAIEKALGAYKNLNLDVVMQANIDAEKKHVYLKTISISQPQKGIQKLEIADSGYSVIENDKSMMQVIVRWANQSGYQTFINGQLVNLQMFPRHVSRYPDYSLIPEARKFKTKGILKEAIGLFIALYSGISLAPFTIRIDDANKKIYIDGLA